MAELGARLSPSPHTNREADQKDVKRGLFPPFDSNFVDRVTSTANVSSPPSVHHPESSQELTSFLNQQTEEDRETITKAADGEVVEEEGIVEVRNEDNTQYMRTEESEGEVMKDNLRSTDNDTYPTSEGITSRVDAQMLPIPSDEIIPLRRRTHDDQINIEQNVSGEKGPVVSNQECGSVSTILQSPVRIIVDHEPPGNQESVNLPCKRGDNDDDHVHITENCKYVNEVGINDGDNCSGGQNKDENGETTTRGAMKEEFGNDHEQGVAIDFESQLSNTEGGHEQIDAGTNTALADGEGSIPEGMRESIAPGDTVPSTEAVRIGSIQPTSEDGGEDITSVEGPISNEINTSFGPSYTEESQTDDLAKEIAPHSKRDDSSSKGNLHVGETQIAGSSLVDTDVCVGSEAMVEEVETVIEEVYTVIKEVNAMSNRNMETQEVRIVNIEEVHTIGNNMEIQTGSSLGEVNLEETVTTGVSSECERHPSLDSQDVELFSVEELVRGELLPEQDVKKDISIETKVREVQADKTKEILSIAEKSRDQMEIVTKIPETQTDKTEGIFSGAEKSPEQVDLVTTNIPQAQPDTSAKEIFSTAEKSPEQMEIVATNIPQTQPDTSAKESLKIAELSPDMQPETASKAEDLHLQKDNAVGHDVSEQEVQEIKGGKVWKRFGRKKYLGDVVDYDPENRWFKVVYEDGDEEDLDLDEVKEILLPRGTLPKSVSKKRGHPGEESDQERKSKQRKKAPTPKKSKAGSKASEGTISRGRKTAEKVKRPYRRRKQQQAESSVSKDVSSTTQSTMTGNEASETDELANVPNSKGEHNIESQHDESATPEKTTSKRGRKKKTQSDTEVSTSSKLLPSVDHLAEEDSKEKRGRKRKIQFDAEVSTSNGKAEETKDDVVQTILMHKDEIASNNQNSTKKQKLSENIGESKSDRLVIDSGEDDSFIGKQVRKDFNGTFYTGVVMEFDKAKKYFKVNYEGREEEVLHLAELETVLIREEICSVSTNH